MNRGYHNGNESHHGGPKGGPTGGPMTVDVEQLASRRIQTFVGTAIRYWSFIGRGGLSVTIILLVILGMIYYQDLLDLIPDHAPIAPVLAAILTFFVARTAHRTFLEEADLMFLTPLEERMDRYFQRTFRYNLVLQCASVLIVLIVFAPLYVDQLAAEGQSVWPYYIVPLLVKGWNLQSSWSVQKLQDARKIRYHALLRFVFTFLFLYWLLAGGTLGLLALFVMILVVFYIFERRVGESLGVNWLHLLELEQQQKARFYSFCNAFIDVPHLPTKVKRRSWAAGLTRFLRFSAEHAYRFLLVKTFFRSGDYFGRYVRLTLLGCIIIYAIDDLWGQAAAYALFIVLVGSQIQSVWGHHADQFWLDIFPIPAGEDRRALKWLSFCLLTIQAVVMAVPFWLTQLEPLVALAVPVSGIALAYGYSYVWLNRSIERLSV